MKPLSALKFFWENKKKSITILTIFFLVIISISFISSLINSVFESAERANLSPVENMSFVSSADGKLFLEDEVVEKIKTFDGVQKTYTCFFENTSIETLMGNSSSPVIFINNKQSISELIDLCGLTLTSGSVLPEPDRYEILLHEDILKNKALKVGGEFGDAINEKEWVAGRYKIVGSFSGNSIISLGSNCFTLQSLQNEGIDTESKVMTLLVIPQKNRLIDMNNSLATLTKNEAKIYTYEMMKKELNDQLASINFIMGMIMFVIIFAMSVSVGALVMIVYSSRNDEFGIVFAIGYTKQNVKNMIMREIGALSTVGWIIGYALSMLLLGLLNLLIFIPIGKPLVIFSIFGVIFTLIVPVMVFACATIPILRKFKKTDLVSIIEKRV